MTCQILRWWQEAIIVRIKNQQLLKGKTNFLSCGHRSIPALGNELQYDCEGSMMLVKQHHGYPCNHIVISCLTLVSTGIVRQT